jgi:hypothetical protein
MNPEIRTIDKEGRVRMLPFFLLRDAKRVVIDRGIQIDDTRNEVMPFIQQLPHVPVIAGGKKQIHAPVETETSGSGFTEPFEAETLEASATIEDEDAEASEVPTIEAPKRGRKKAQPNQ